MADRLKTIVKRWSRQRLPQLNGRIYLPALQATVTIRRDQWGVPHVHAQTRHDLYFAQGFVHAQDRLWQMELNRRAATGTLSAVFGALTLETDRFSRTFGFARLAPRYPGQPGRAGPP
jgi:penicillin amidase